MKKIVQIMPQPEGWEAAFLSYDKGGFPLRDLLDSAQFLLIVEGIGDQDAFMRFDHNQILLAPHDDLAHSNLLGVGHGLVEKGKQIDSYFFRREVVTVRVIDRRNLRASA